MLYPLWARHLFAVAAVDAENTSLLVPVHTDLEAKSIKNQFKLQIK